MKSGTGDDPFADESPESEDEDRGDDQTGREKGEAAVQATGAERRTELPYKYQRASVKEGRQQQPVFLQADTRELIAETVAEMEAEFDETVYKTDVVEAMLVAGGENARPADVLRRWGYGMKNG